MAKIIEINKCGECPHFRRLGDAATITGAVCKHPVMTKDLTVMFAGDPPDWCPLEDSEDFAESNFDIDRKF